MLLFIKVDEVFSSKCQLIGLAINVGIKYFWIPIFNIKLIIKKLKMPTKIMIKTLYLLDICGRIERVTPDYMKSSK